MGFQEIAEGTLISDGSEQVLLQQTDAGRYSGYIDLSGMIFGDIVIVREYILIGNTYKIYHTESLVVPTDPILYILPKESLNGIRLTLQQTVGGFKSYPYQFIIEVIAGPAITL